MHVRALLARTVASLPAPCQRSGPVVHLALSGGVDSSVAGVLLRERGWDVRPVLMRCWADADDAEAGTPCFERELRAAERTVEALGLKRRLAVFDFVSEYWTKVFQDVLLAGLQAGDTPNQDLACNAAIKFGSFPHRLAEENATSGPPPFATGHYARLYCAPGMGQATLLRALDVVKDQTYFLASVPSAALRQAIFPVGGLLKTEVREIAKHVGLPAAHQKSSRGICFVGKRDKAAFMERYMAQGSSDPNEEGYFILNDTMEKVAPLAVPAYAYTVGQRARVGGQVQSLYVVGRQGPDILVSSFKLSMNRVVCDRPVWIAGSAPTELEDRSAGMGAECKSCSSGPTMRCTVSTRDNGGLEVCFESPQEAKSPGQVIVFYRGEEVLGCAAISRLQEPAK
jgi:tRNA (5-methylaminomethyl-2-thiouridylate)-methyltransferase